MAFLIACLLALPVSAQSPAPRPKDEVKAVFLFDFTKFVDWPPVAFTGPGSPFVMAVLGDDVLAGFLRQVVAGETAKGRPIAVARLSQPEAIPACQVLYVSRSQRRSLREVLARVRGAPVLTVAEMDEFTKAGGMINFQVRQGKLRFEINKPAADAAGLKISAQLLGLALNSRTP